LRSDATAALVHEVAFCFLSNASLSASPTASGAFGSVSAVLR